MEKEWDNFWVTGKVEDYLTYKNHYRQEERDTKTNGRDDYVDRNGDKHHADFGI